MGITGNSGTYHAFHSCIALSMHGFRLSDSSGDVGATAANGGILASDTVPIMRSGASALISQEISWAAAAVNPIVCQVALPPDFDGREDVLLDLWVSSGTSDAATFGVGSSWDGAATVTDSASDAATLSATAHRIRATIAAADIPDGASYVTILLTPPAHATNAIQLHSARLLYLPRKTS